MWFENRDILSKKNATDIKIAPAGNFPAGTIFYRCLGDVIVIAHNSKECYGNNDAHKAYTINPFIHIIIEVAMFVCISQYERQGQHSVHDPIHDVEALPAKQQYEEGKAGNDDQEQIFAWFFLLYRRLLRRCNFMLNFFVLSCHEKSPILLK